MTTAVLAQLHDAKTHRLDARRIARLFGLSYRELGRAIRESENTVKAPRTSAKLQPKLQQLALAYEQLQTMIPAEYIPTWMRHPIKRLQGQTPLAYFLKSGLDGFTALTEEIDTGTYA